jgi:glucan phosphoethanolaminetransferase (alkaline phosphatase superfamily)
MALGVGIDYGAPNMSLVASALETNASESLEFLANLNWRDCLLSVLTIILLFVHRFVLLEKSYDKSLVFKKSLWIFLLIVNVFGLFTYHCVVAYKKYIKEKPVVGEILKSVDWEIQEIKHNRSLKVLVVGKVSASDICRSWEALGLRRLSAASPKVTAFTHYYSPAPNTVTSLSRTLTHSRSSDGEFDLNRNVVALAKAAGYSTLWVSNQRSMGPNDSNVARMAHQADQHRFLDKMPVIEPAKDDFALLNYLRDKLEQPEALPQDSMVFSTCWVRTRMPVHVFLTCL